VHNNRALYITEHTTRKHVTERMRSDDSEKKKKLSDLTDINRCRTNWEMHSQRNNPVAIISLTFDLCAAEDSPRGNFPRDEFPPSYF
jgi:hypothetical protein